MANSKLKCTPLGLEMLEGRHVSLARAAPEYLEFIYSCYQNDSFMDLYRLAQSRTVSKPEVLQRLETEQCKLPQELRRIEWVILKHEEGLVPIGLAALADHQVSHRRAEFLLGILDTQNRAGYLGLEASLLVLDFAFNQVGLHKVTSFVYGYNSYAQKNTLHLGFTQEGLLAQHIHTRKGFIDLYQNGLLRADFLDHKSLSRWSRRLLNKDITQAQSAKIAAVSELLLEQLQQQLSPSSPS